MNESDPIPFVEALEGPSFKKQVFANDSLGG